MLAGYCQGYNCPHAAQPQTLNGLASRACAQTSQPIVQHSPDQPPVRIVCRSLLEHRLPTRQEVQYLVHALMPYPGAAKAVNDCLPNLRLHTTLQVQDISALAHAAVQARYVGSLVQLLASRWSCVGALASGAW